MKHFKISLLFLIIFSLFLGGVIGLIIIPLQQLPSLKPLEYKGEKWKFPTKIYDVKNELIAELCEEQRERVSLLQIPQYLIEATLAMEDIRFYKHYGIDLRGITRALIINLKAGKVIEGGSTITQQLSKVLFLTRERTLKRKIKELFLALKIEKKYSKEEILELYFNQIYYGHGAYGVEAAAQLYFGKHAEDLNLAECALIVGLPRSPNKYSPYRNPELAYRRRNIVLKRMQKVGFITRAQVLKAQQSPFNLHKFEPPPNKAPYFVEYVRRKLEKKYGSRALYRGGLRIFTTLDLKMQLAAQKALKEGIKKIDKTLGTYLPQEENEILEGKVKTLIPEGAIISLEGKEGILLLENPEKVLMPQDKVKVEIKESANKNIYIELVQRPHLQGAMVVLEPQTGEIRALVGGYDFYDDFNQGKFNRAVQARRQPGSAFKPFLYATALERRWTAADTIFDSPIIFKKEKREEESKQEDWIPQNYQEKFWGAVTLRKMLAHSINVASIKLLKKVGVRKVIKYAHKMGIESRLNSDLTLALGSSAVTPLEITAGYATIANLGMRLRPYALKYVEDYSGRTLEENTSQGKEVLSPQTAYIMINLMQGVIENGTGQRIRWLGFNLPCAGKTGTTNNCINAWFVGFTPTLVTTVYIGYDNRISLGEKMTGSKVAIPIWTQFMKEVSAGKPLEEFFIPEGITFVKIDTDSGLLASAECKNVIEEAFLKGTEPTEYSDFPRKDKFIEALPSLGLKIKNR